MKGSADEKVRVKSAKDEPKMGMKILERVALETGKVNGEQDEDERWRWGVKWEKGLAKVNCNVCLPIGTLNRLASDHWDNLYWFNG